MSFDHDKWSFLLVACVIGWLLLMGAIFLGTCLVWPTTLCQTEGRFGELMQTILASALAYGAGRSVK